MKRFFSRKALFAFMAGVLITFLALGTSAVFAKSKFSQEDWHTCPPYSS